MIQIYTWQIGIPGGGEGLALEHCRLATQAGAKIMAYTGFLKGVTAQVVPEGVLLEIRVHGKDRWAAQAHAKDLAPKVLAAARLATFPITHVSTVIEPNRWTLKDGEGRTPRPRPARQA